MVNNMNELWVVAVSQSQGYSNYISVYTPIRVGAISHDHLDNMRYNLNYLSKRKGAYYAGTIEIA